MTAAATIAAVIVTHNRVDKLVKVLEDKWGVSAAAPVAMAGMPMAGAGEAAAEQAPPPLTFTTGVEQVIVDLVVTDKKGNPVAGITRDDLVITPITATPTMARPVR